MTIDPTALNTLHQALNAPPANQDWLVLLSVFEPLGLADMLQLQTATGFSRDKINGLLNKFERLTGNLLPILKKLDHDLPRADGRGRPAQIYLLKETGAALLRLSGQADSWPCGLKNDTEISHARALLDLVLKAHMAGLKFSLDRKLEYDRTDIRPDLLITIGNDLPAIFEIEQLATIDLLRRLLGSLTNKAAFFRNTEPERVQTAPIVRMLIALPRGRAFDKTVQIWRTAIAQLTRSQSALPFQLWTMPLPEFLSDPDWSAAHSERWLDLTQPMVEVPSAAMSSQRAALQPAITLPRRLTRRSAYEDRLVLEALSSWLSEYAVQQPTAYRGPDPELFELARVIYSASHDTVLPALERSGFPHASLYLLKMYLQRNPGLSQAWLAALRSGVARSWNPTLVMAKMQFAIGAFLKYHGWSLSGLLRVHPVVSDWTVEEDRTFGVRVKILSGELLMTERNGIVPNEAEIRAAEQALSWVLWSMFNYASEVGLKLPVFW
jgi:hypothetical protein